MYWTTASSEVPTGRPVFTTKRSKSSWPRWCQSVSLPMRPSPLMPRVRCPAMKCGPPAPSCGLARPMHANLAQDLCGAGHGIIGALCRSCVPHHCPSTPTPGGPTWPPRRRRWSSRTGTRRCSTRSTGCTVCARRSPTRWASTSTRSATPTTSSRASRPRCCATGPTSSGPTTARGCSTSSPNCYRAARSPLTRDQFSLLLRTLLSWCAAALKGPFAAEYDAPLGAVGDALLRLLPAHTAGFLERDALVRNLVEVAAARPPLAAAYLGLLRELLIAAYAEVGGHLDVPGWARGLEVQDGLTDSGAVVGCFEFLSARRTQRLAGEAREAAAEELLSPRFPLLSELLDEAIHQLFLVQNLEDRFAVCLFFLKDETLGYRQRDVMADLLGVVKQLMKPDRHTDADPHPGAAHGLLPRPQQRVPAHPLPVLRGHRRRHRRGRQRQGGRPPHRGHPLLEVPVPGHQRHHRGVGDGGQSVPPAQDPLLDAHHRVQPGAVRAAGRGAQRPAPPRAACTSPTPTSSSATSRASSTPTSGPSTSSPSSCCAPSPCTSARSGRRASCARSPRRSTSSAPARHAHALPAQAGARGVVQPPRGVQPRGHAVLAHARHLRAGPVPLGEHHGGRARGAGWAEGPQRALQGLRGEAARGEDGPPAPPRTRRSSTSCSRSRRPRWRRA